MKTALLSVSDKSGLVPFARGLAEAGIHLLSTGGTAKTLREAGLDVQDVADYTGDPEIFEGRVKTLNPKIHGAILWDRSKADHKATAVAEGIGEIDLVVVNLYPFTQTVASGADFQTCIENIDIGGPAMVRASAKNHASVGIVVDPSDYEAVLVEIKADGALSNTKRKQLAAKAYAHTAAYDSAISGWFAAEVEEQFPEQLSFTGNVDEVLRYGENPHQFAAFYKDGSNRAGVATAEQLQGKSLSYNNLNDTDAAFEAVCEFEDPAVVIVKHANPCGVATAPSGDLFQAYDKAHACDTVSAFGGIVALNRPLDGPTAERISQIFTEVIIAPSVDDSAQAVLSQKKNLRVLQTGGLATPDSQGYTFKSISGGMLVQSRDAGRVQETELKVVTKRAPTKAELADLIFAFRVAKHVKSNAIVYAKDGATVGIGAGQMSRVDSSRIAAHKATQIVEGQNMAEGSVVASDAFFPFADGLEAAIAAGATAVIQPGGSMRDDDVIAAANAAGIAMVFTGMRHFRH